MTIGEEMSLSAFQRLRVVGESPEALEIESVWRPGGTAPPWHWHPQQEERFEFLEGEVTVDVAGSDQRVFTAGETLVVPARTRHRMWNGGAEPARARWRITPPLRTLEMFRFIDRGTALPRALRMLWAFRREFRIGRVR